MHQAAFGLGKPQLHRKESSKLNTSSDEDGNSPAQLSQIPCYIT